MSVPGSLRANREPFREKGLNPNRLVMGMWHKIPPMLLYFLFLLFKSWSPGEIGLSMKKMAGGRKDQKAKGDRRRGGEKKQRRKRCSEYGNVETSPMGTMTFKA